jgi:long-chain acyl-CoA synthetase
VLLPRFDAKAALRLMQKHRITIFAGVPTMYFALLHFHPAPTSTTPATLGALRVRRLGDARRGDDRLRREVR